MTAEVCEFSLISITNPSPSSTTPSAAIVLVKEPLSLLIVNVPVNELSVKSDAVIVPRFPLMV